MPFYRKKPVVITAVQFNGTNFDEIREFAGDVVVSDGTRLVIKTLEGAMNVSVGDFVIRGVQGEYYPCKPDIFLATYDAL